MEKLHELVKISEKLLEDGFLIGTRRLSYDSDDFLDEDDVSFEEYYQKILGNILHSGLDPDFAVFEVEEEVSFNGITVFEIVSEEIISIYDKEQIDLYISGNMSLYQNSKKNIGFETRYWYVMSCFSDLK
jgi:hypothetical protein